MDATTVQQEYSVLANSQVMIYLPGGSKLLIDTTEVESPTIGSVNIRLSGGDTTMISCRSAYYNDSELSEADDTDFIARGSALLIADFEPEFDEDDDEDDDEDEDDDWDDDDWDDEDEEDDE